MPEGAGWCQKWLDVPSDQVLRVPVRLDGGGRWQPVRLLGYPAIRPEYTRPGPGHAWAVAVDSSRMYYATLQSSQIWAANLDGSNVQTIAATHRACAGPRYATWRYTAASCTGPAATAAAAALWRCTRSASRPPRHSSPSHRADAPGRRGLPGGGPAVTADRRRPVKGRNGPEMQIRG